MLRSSARFRRGTRLYGEDPGAGGESITAGRGATPRGPGPAPGLPSSPTSSRERRTGQSALPTSPPLPQSPSGPRRILTSQPVSKPIASGNNRPLRQEGHAPQRLQQGREKRCVGHMGSAER